MRKSLREWMFERQARAWDKLARVAEEAPPGNTWIQNCSRGVADAADARAQAEICRARAELAGRYALRGAL